MVNFILWVLIGPESLNLKFEPSQLENPLIEIKDLNMLMLKYSISICPLHK